MLLPLYDNNPYRRTPWITLLLIAVNILVMWQVVQLGERKQTELFFERGFVPQRLSQVDDPLPVVIVQPRLDAEGNPDPNRPPIEIRLANDSVSVYSTLLSTQFLHGGWLHLIMNMWMLWVFGNNIEDRLGHFVYLGFYLAGGVVATLCHWVVDPASLMPVVGASGAVAAVLGGYALTYPEAKVRTFVFVGIPLLLNLPALLVLGLWMVLETIAGLLQLQLGVGVGVAHWAHVGGFLAGVVLMPLLSIGSSPPGEDWKSESDELFQFVSNTNPPTN